MARECNAQNTASKGKVPKYTILHYCIELSHARALLKSAKGRKKDAIAMIQGVIDQINQKNELKMQDRRLKLHELGGCAPDFVQLALASIS